VYPIKSAAPVPARSWPLGPNGLALDREWALVNPNGGALRRGRHPLLATIQPRIDFEAGGSPLKACTQTLQMHAGMFGPSGGMMRPMA
jgi:uncharacterized protein YcbX